jgi:hypothetical protein
MCLKKIQDKDTEATKEGMLWMCLHAEGVGVFTLKAWVIKA